VAIAMERKDTLASVNRSDPPAMEKNKAVAIVIEKKDAVASAPLQMESRHPSSPLQMESRHPPSLTARFRSIGTRTWSGRTPRR
jgi:hypothetical protein